MVRAIPRRRGLTLVELLVVTAIIAVLAAILVPVVARAREKGRQGVCGAHLRQLGMAHLQYAADHEDRLPPALRVIPGPGVWPHRPAVTWRWCIQPYVRSRDVLYCPSSPVRDFAPAYPDWPGDAGYAMGYTHALGLTPGATLPVEHGVPLADVQAPAAWLLLGEGDGGPLIGYARATTHGFRPWYEASFRHHGGSLYLFGDGHLRWFSPWQVRCTPTHCVWSVEDPG